MQIGSTKQVVEYSVTEAEIAKLRVKYADVPANLEDKTNYEYVRKAIADLRTKRTDIEKRRKELKADALAWGKLVDSRAKEITEQIVEIEEPLATAKKEFDTAIEIAKREAALAEERRIDSINERIAGIRAMVTAHISSPSHVIDNELDNITDLAVGGCEWADEFAGKAREAVQETISKLQELLVMRRQQEEAATIAAAEEAKRQAAEEEARKQREIEAERERAKIAAERKAMEEERKAMDAERDRLAKEQEARDAAAAAERKKLEEQLAEVRRQQEPPPPPPPPPPAPVTSESYRAAGNALLLIIGNKPTTKAVLDAIINGEIPHITYGA